MANNILTVAEVAARWSCSTHVVLDRIRSGELTAFNVGAGKRATWRIRLTSVETFERSRTKRVEPPAPVRGRIPVLAKHERTWH